MFTKQIKLKLPDSDKEVTVVAEGTESRLWGAEQVSVVLGGKPIVDCAVVVSLKHGVLSKRVTVKEEAGKWLRDHGCPDGMADRLVREAFGDKPEEGPFYV